MRRHLQTVVATVGLLLGAAPGIAGAQPLCADLGGTVGADQVCTSHTSTPDYTLDISFPVGYPDPEPVQDFVTHTRAEWVTAAEDDPMRNPGRHVLAISGTAYQTATTQSLVFALSSDFGAHPVGTFRAFNYDVTQSVPITLATLFRPGTNVAQLLAPIVKRELGDRAAEGPDWISGLDDTAYQNFALTDDAVIFFFAQGLLLPQVDGPQRISVPRAELASVLA
ncbi:MULTISPECIES: esterase [unclassified Mycolicibacterium]|uniref:esterase n=1 Tax=unclassified Mycolicibacterium TaxID=2636767 RepID=UPI002EDADB62